MVLGISACLLGKNVRYNGKHKRHPFLATTLSRYVDVVPVCPEVEMGLPVPRPCMRLVITSDEENPRLICQKTGIDYTERMLEWADKRLDDLEKSGLSGFIFKSKSPSCGLGTAVIHDAQGKGRTTGNGLFVRAFRKRFPRIPVDDETSVEKGMMIKQQQKTIEILSWFEKINKIPRGSKNEEQIGQWLLAWAADEHFEALRDPAGNVLIRVPGSPGSEHAAPVIIQGHLDMVCEKRPGSDHDFDKDPIRHVYDGEWLKADQTSLGADNGIAIAMGMTAALDKTLNRPPLELLFTVDEETALTGAFALEPGFLQGKRLLNIDSEKEGVFTIGSAGGERSDHTLSLNVEPIPAGYVAVTLEAADLSGGHSADILQEKANALKILARTLHGLQSQIDIRLAYFVGGSADNAIPRLATAVIFIDKKYFRDVIGWTATMEKLFRTEFKNTDPDMSVRALGSCKDIFHEAVDSQDTQRIIRLLLGLPHGIFAMSTELEHAIETSNNLASAALRGKRFHLVTSQRSPVESRLDDITRRISSVVALAGGETVTTDRYPGWNADKESGLLKECTAVYEKLFETKPIVETTHGGLECGVIKQKFPDIDMISFGPTIHDPHSPDERIHIPSIERVWDFLTALLEELR